MTVWNYAAPTNCDVIRFNSHRDDTYFMQWEKIFQTTQNTTRKTSWNNKASYVLTWGEAKLFTSLSAQMPKQKLNV